MQTSCPPTGPSSNGACRRSRSTGRKGSSAQLAEVSPTSGKPSRVMQALLWAQVVSIDGPIAAATERLVAEIADDKDLAARRRSSDTRRRSVGDRTVKEERQLESPLGSRPPTPLQLALPARLDEVPTVEQPCSVSSCDRCTPTLKRFFELGSLVKEAMAFERALHPSHQAFLHSEAFCLDLLAPLAPQRLCTRCER